MFSKIKNKAQFAETYLLLITIVPYKHNVTTYRPDLLFYWCQKSARISSRTSPLQYQKQNRKTHSHINLVQKPAQERPP